jgi:hypothetical protein
MTLERMLCMEENEFYSKFNASNDQSHSSADQFCYTKIGKFLVRAQLDCFSDKIEGKEKTFDIKTVSFNFINFSKESNSNDSKKYSSI